jgi:putative intracellular protease/amidase
VTTWRAGPFSARAAVISVGAMHAQIVLFDGFDALDAIAPFEVFTAGGIFSGGRITTELVSAEGPREVPSGLPGMSLRATATLDPSTVDIVVVPGAAGPMPDTDPPVEDMDTIPAILARALDTPLPKLLKEALDRPGLTVATVCGGSLLLAMAGLIDGRPVTTHHLAMGALGPQALDARVVDDGDLVTAGSVTSGLDMALYLLERELDPQTAIAVEHLFAHERRGTVWRSA